MSVKKDSIGDRMKKQYEDRTRVHLPRRTYTIIRIDGKAFHTYTRGSAKPYDFGLMSDMDTAAMDLCAEMMGCQCAYGQSDEYSFLLTDFASENAESWFDGNVQKIASVAASTFAVAFYAQRVLRATRNDGTSSLAQPAFDARVFTIPDRVEVENYFIWRQQDATRNAILMAGYAKFSPKQMHGLNVNQVQEQLFIEHGINFNNYPTNAKRGRVIWKENYEITENGGVAQRSRWSVDSDMPLLTAERAYFESRLYIPRYPA